MIAPADQDCIAQLEERINQTDRLATEVRSITALAESLVKTQQELKEERDALKTQLKRAEHEAKVYRDMIDSNELIRCLRAARDSYRSETYSLKDRIAELEQLNDSLNDDVMNLEAMLRSARSPQLAAAA